MLHALAVCCRQVTTFQMNVTCCCLQHPFCVLQGIPRDEDGVLHALAVCAPYPVLAGYRYKVKLTPGGQKRGKAARQAHPRSCGVTEAFMCMTYSLKPLDTSSVQKEARERHVS